MKIGILSNVHVDPRALRRTLEDVSSVDGVLCAGDAILDMERKEVEIRRVRLD